MEGRHSHPNQDAARRHSLAHGQRPLAVFFGCADSRVAAEIIFDMGLGDLFVIRTAGHVVDTGVLGSLEFGVGVLDIPLIVILGHDSCGAVAATMAAVDNGVLPGGYIRDIVERVTPSVLTAHRAGLTSADEIETEHVRHTIRLLVERSSLIADRIESGRLAVVGAAYNLDEGRARMVDAVGDLGDPRRRPPRRSGRGRRPPPVAGHRTAARPPPMTKGLTTMVVSPFVVASRHACGGGGGGRDLGDLFERHTGSCGGDTARRQYPRCSPAVQAAGQPASGSRARGARGRPRPVARPAAGPARPRPPRP